MKKPNWDHMTEGKRLCAIFVSDQPAVLQKIQTVTDGHTDRLSVDAVQKVNTIVCDIYNDPSFAPADTVGSEFPELLVQPFCTYTAAESVCASPGRGGPTLRAGSRPPGSIERQRALAYRPRAYRCVFKQHARREMRAAVRWNQIAGPVSLQPRPAKMRGPAFAVFGECGKKCFVPLAFRRRP
eukprot:COSAG06_NODE_1638_length_8838_cov_4.151619_3_plen_183_part_00